VPVEPETSQNFLEQQTFMEEEQQHPGADWTLVYIAKKLKEAQELEQLFESNGIDYDVQPDTYRGGIIFVTERIGAFFYVEPEQADKARQLLTQNNYKPYKVG
jgi:hypothetical protein